MFGFIKAPCRSCSASAASEYRAWFCGLGCALSRSYSPLARFLVNHDSTFLSIAADQVNPGRATPVVRTCCNPLAKPRALHSDDWATDYAAAVTVCALRVKLADEVDDEGGLRRKLGQAASVATSPAADKATAVLNTLGFPTREIWGALEDRDTCETPNSGLREAASPTAIAYRKIFEFPANYFEKKGGQQSSFGQLGESMGRLVYWKDALDDREEDLKYGRYNPLSYHREERLLERIGEEVRKFGAAAAIIGEPAALLPSLASTSTDYHFAASGTPIKELKRRRDKQKDCWCSYCGDCGCGSCDCGDCGCGGCDCSC
ncbi:DUF5685 family protein [Verrucomicrobiales bacterium]|nr:DUF5685 family protein [Verrucomicrobiales bacterium]